MCDSCRALNNPGHPSVADEQAFHALPEETQLIARRVLFNGNYQLGFREGYREGFDEGYQEAKTGE